MQTEPDVLTDHSELILSTNIERTVSGRDAALVQIEQLIQQLDAVSRPGKIHEHARIYRLRSVAGSQILNFMS